MTRNTHKPERPSEKDLFIESVVATTLGIAGGMFITATIIGCLREFAGLAITRDQLDAAMLPGMVLATIAAFAVVRWMR